MAKEKHSDRHQNESVGDQRKRNRKSGSELSGSETSDGEPIASDVQKNSVSPGRRITPGRIAQILLGLVGISLFVLLARKVDFTSLPESSLEHLPQFVLTVLGLLALNYTFDTGSWWLVCGEKRPSIFQLMLIRVRCEGITNILPGGAVIGEPMKIGFLMDASGMSRPEATASFLLSKFVLIIGQTLYIFLGLALAFGIINRVSERVFGISNFAFVVLGGALLILLLILTIAGAMIWFQPLNSRFVFSEREGRLARWWNVILGELREIEILLAGEFRRHRYRLLLAILFSFIAWSLNGVELFVIARWLNLDAAFSQIYAIDAVSVVVRMLVFVIPIGMGGQDWTIRGLVTAYGFADPATTAARLVVMKRSREFFMIGLGLLLLILLPRQKRSRAEKEGWGEAV